jgi:tetratricopeptide (TPR) repeat protein
MRSDIERLSPTGLIVAAFALWLCVGDAIADDYDWTKDSPACGEVSNAEAAVVACGRIISATGVPRENLSYAYLDRGRAFARLQRWDAAHQDLTLAVDRKMQDTFRRGNAEFDLQVVRVELGHYQAAREGFWKLAVDPDTGRAASAIWALASDPKIGETDSPRLIEAARALVDREDAPVLTHRVLGLTLAAGGKRDEALEEVTKAYDELLAAEAGSSLEKQLQSYARKAIESDIEMIKAGRPIVTDVSEFLN